MTSTLVHRTYTIVLVAALCAAVALLLTSMLLEGVSPADEILGRLGGYGELPQVW
jgi:hypothetical protein